MVLPPLQLLGPRHWLSWVVVLLVWGGSHFPWHGQVVIGRWLGGLLLRFPKKYRHVAEVNIQQCFPVWTAEERAQLLKRNCEAHGVALFETALAWWAPDERIQSLFSIHGQGVEHIYEGLRKGKGVILCSAHFLSMELVGRCLMRELPFAVVYRPQKNGVLDFVSYAARTRQYLKVIPYDDARGILAALRENQVVWYTPDIDPGRRRTGVFAPFFDVPAYVTTALSRMARISGACVVPGFPYRRKDGAGYDLVVGASLEAFPSNSMIQDATGVNQLIEQAVRQSPEQYLWRYKRFKTRPPGEHKLYE